MICRGPCAQDLPLPAFPVNAKMATGHENRCLQCKRDAQKAYYAANRERLLSRYSGRIVKNQMVGR